MYGEILIAINMLFNYAILSFANKVGNIQAASGRLWFASFAGALPVVILPSSFVVIVIAFIAMTVCAFGWSFERWSKSVSMVLIGAVVAGGLLTALQLRLQLFGQVGNVLVCALIAYFALFLMKRKWLDTRMTNQVASLRSDSLLQIWNAEVALTVFVDSGNACTEPLSGAPVHFISFGAVEPYLPADLIAPLLSWDHKGTPDLSGFPDAFKKDIRLIRLLTVQGSSWAVGFKYDRWTLENGEVLRPGYVVLTKNDRRYPTGAGAILHVSAMESFIGERGIVHVA